MSGEGGSDDPDIEVAKAATPSPILAALPVLRPGAKGDGVVGGVADVVRVLDLAVSDIFTAVAMPLGPFSGVELPAGPGLKLSSNGDNRIHASIALKDGASPKVSLWFDRPIDVKGPFPMPHAELSSIWFDGDHVQTDAHYHVPLLDMIPGLSRMPGDLANQIVRQTAGGFEPLMRLLHARAQAGQLPDAQAIGAALAGAPDAPLPEGLEPIAASLDRSQVRGTGEMTLKRRISADAPNGATVIAGEGTKIKAEILVDLVAGHAGELGIVFDPPIHIHSLEAGAWLVMPSIRSMRVSPEGGVAIEAGSFMNIARDVVQEEADVEAKRIEAFLRVLYAEIPPDGDLGKALRRAGVGPL